MKSKPPPVEPPDPGVIQALLDTIATCGWSSDHLIDTSGASRYLGIVPSRKWPSGGRWDVAPSGASLSRATYEVLRAGRANANGSFTSGDVTYRLADQGGVAVHVQV